MSNNNQTRGGAQRPQEVPNKEHLMAVKQYLVTAIFTMSQKDQYAWKLVSAVP